MMEAKSEILYVFNQCNAKLLLGGLYQNACSTVFAAMPSKSLKIDKLVNH